MTAIRYKKDYVDVVEVDGEQVFTANFTIDQMDAGARLHKIISKRARTALILSALCMTVQIVALLAWIMVCLVR